MGFFSRSLKCRRCAVVGNGHRLRNSSMGETINTYDVVIRYSPGSILLTPPQCHLQVGLRPMMSLCPPSKAEQRPSPWLRAGRGLQDHHAPLLPRVGPL